VIGNVLVLSGQRTRVKEGWSAVNGGVPWMGECGVHGVFFLT